MRKLGVLGLFALLVLSSCASGTPDLKVESDQIDLGEVTNGEIRSVDLTVENRGNADLIIEAVTTSCGCTSAEVEPATISPGEQGMLHIEFDSGAHGPEANGPVTRQIFIASNDPDQPEVEVRLLAQVLPKGP